MEKAKSGVVTWKLHAPTNINTMLEGLRDREIDLNDEEHLKIFLKYRACRKVNLEASQMNPANILSLTMFLYIEQILRWKDEKKLMQLEELKKAYDEENKDRQGDYCMYFGRLEEGRSLSSEHQKNILRLTSDLIDNVKKGRKIDDIIKMLQENFIGATERLEYPRVILIRYIINI